MHLLIRVLFVLALIAFVWWVLRPRYDFAIRVRGNEVSLAGKLPQARQGEVLSFFQDRVAFDGNVRVSGRRTRDGQLLLRFQGNVPERTRQQVRNFLLTVV